MATRTLPLIEPRPTGGGCCDSETRPSITLAEAERATEDLEILAHPVRLQLLDMLVRSDGAVCVCDLEAGVPVKQPTVSHHLKLLRAADLVSSERQGLYAYYQVNRPALQALRTRIADRLATLA